MLAVIKYWKLMAIGLAIVASFFAGKTWESNYRDSVLLKERNQALSAYEKEAQRAYKLSKELEKLRKQRQADRDAARTELAEVIRRSDVYSRECINDDGLHILNDALSGAASGERHGTMLTTDPANRENGQGSSGEDH